jgi:release factor glutamine methyltransferase
MLEWCAGFFEKKEIDPPRLSAELLLAHVLKYPRIKLYTDLNRTLTEAELDTIRALVKRAAEHEPIQYLTGRAHFYSLEFDVTRDVLIPRSDTETLVDRALARLKERVGTEPPRVLELCTGSGCVAAAIASNSKSATIVATDVSLPALDVARKNVERLKLSDRIELRCGDLYAALDGLVDARPFDLIVANPPYIATAQLAGLDRNVIEYEPRLALDGGPDGLDPHRKILAGAFDRLVAGGKVLMEIAFDQEEAALWMLRQDPRFIDARCFRDLAGRPRVIEASKA